jgi:hypothetical protein
MERGTHTELLAAGGHYADLYQAQFAGQEQTQALLDAATAAVPNGVATSVLATA